MSHRPPAGPPPGNVPPPPPGGGYPPQPPQGGGYPPPRPPQGGGYQPPQGGGYPPPQGGGYPPPRPPQPPQGGGYQQQPPQGGGYPQPPPPQGGGYPPPPPPDSGGAPPAGYGPPSSQTGVLPKEAYTPWITRVGAFIIDYIPYAVIVGIGVLVNLLTQEEVCVTDTSGFDLGDVCATGASTVGQLSLSIAVLVGLAYIVWNYGYKQGTTGSSIGKSVMKFKVVSEKTGEPIGFGMSVVRQIAHVVDAVICYIGYLFPLWDAKRQTLADKIMTTICVPTSR